MTKEIRTAQDEFTRLFGDIWGTTLDKVSRYPLTNIATDTDENLVIEVAIAGFDKKEIGIEVKGNELHILGSKNTDETVQELNYFQKHISHNEFKRVIVLNKIYVNGDISAKVDNGILTVIIKPKQLEKQVIVIE
jgi:HSP20 family molecular chaperone IbpA